MTSKVLAAVFIGVFLAQVNCAIDTDFLKTYELYNKKIGTFLGEASKLVEKCDHAFCAALDAAKTELKNVKDIISDDQVIILDNLRIHGQSAKLCSQGLLDYLKNNTEAYILSLELAMPKIAQDLENDIKKRVEDAGGNVDRIKSCEQKYETDLNKTMDWVLVAQGGCIMDQIADGELIVEDILKISYEISKLLTAISEVDRSDWKNEIKKLMDLIEQLSGTFPIDEANLFIESKSEQLIKFLKCSALKISEFFLSTLVIIDKIIECTKGL